MDTGVQATSSSTASSPSSPARGARDLPASHWTTVKDGQWIKGFAQGESPRHPGSTAGPTATAGDAKHFRVNVGKLEIKMDHLMAAVKDLEDWELLQEEQTLFSKCPKEWGPTELFAARKVEADVLEKCPAL
eukprot:7136176-Alexandrium_andersonii.AAC.1